MCVNLKFSGGAFSDWERFLFDVYKDELRREGNPEGSLELTEVDPTGRNFRRSANLWAFLPAG
jgi:hypothetical protein